MSSDYSNPNKNFDVYGKGQTPNPFYSIANQFVPRNLHDVIKWSRYILTQSPTTVEVIRKLATYPITDFKIDSSSSSTRDKYNDILKSIKLKSVLNDIGFDYYTLGNVYVSIYFPIKRTLTCPSCGTSYDARECSPKIKFVKYRFVGTCAKCAFAGVFNREDRRSNSIEDINIIKWQTENISVNHNPITGESEYFYQIPQATRRRIMLGDPNFIATVPWSMIEAVKENQDFKFDKGSVFHLKTISMGSVLEGLGMPPVISLYSSIFHQTLLKRANEAVATEHMTPMRILYPQQGSQAGDPIAMMSMGNFVQNMESQMKSFKGDPNHVMIAPIPIGYQAVGGQGRALLVSQELQFVEESILMGMGVSRELLSGTSNWTSSTVGLRLLENTMYDYTSQIQELIDWCMTRISSYLNISSVKVELQPFTLTDDQTLKQALPVFLERGLVSESTALSAFDIDFNAELEKIKKDAIAKAVAEVDRDHEVRMAVFMKSKDVNSESQDDNGFKESQEKATEYANQIISMEDPNQQSRALFNLYNTDQTLYNQVALLLQQYTAIQEGARQEATQAVNTEKQLTEPTPREQYEDQKAQSEASASVEEEKPEEKSSKKKDPKPTDKPKE
jgi:hypothetical protein